MPGRRGKQRVKRKKSKLQRRSEMECLLVNSIHGRRRKEHEILKDHIPPAVKLRANKVVLSSTLPMFQPLPLKSCPSSAKVLSEVKPLKTRKTTTR